jgi:hypothetical protein
MFQIGFGMNVQAGSMLLVYMSGNLAMKAPRHRHSSLWISPGAVDQRCALPLTLFGCAAVSPCDSLMLVCPLLFFAGMTRSMNFTAITTLAFADVPDAQRAGASALATMLQQVAMALGVALAACALGTSQALRGASELALIDFRHAWIAIGVLMAAAAVATLRLDPAAGAVVRSEYEHADVDRKEYRPPLLGAVRAPLRCQGTLDRIARPRAIWGPSRRYGCAPLDLRRATPTAPRPATKRPRLGLWHCCRDHRMADRPRSGSSAGHLRQASGRRRPISPAPQDDPSDMTSTRTSPTRFGDYLHVRPAHPDTRSFSAFGYAVNKTSGTPPAEDDRYIYVEFGREAIAPPPLH